MRNLSDPEIKNKISKTPGHEILRLVVGGFFYGTRSTVGHGASDRLKFLEKKRQKRFH